MVRKALTFILLVTVIFGRPAFTQAEPYPDSADRQVVQVVCGQIMGIWSGDVFYSRCQDTVSYILKARAKQAQRVAAYSDCREREIKAPSTSLNACVLYSNAMGSPKPLQVVYPGGLDTEPGKWFDDTSSAVQASRERYACTQLDFMPGTASFDGCEQSLKEAVMPNRW